LEPWKHYVPVRSDLADLRDAVAWFVNHDTETREIGLRGRELALSIDMKSALDVSANNLIRWLAHRKP
jgi:hypothetical protein